MRLPKSFAREVEERRPLSGLTTFRIGGPAEMFARPRTVRALREMLAWLRERKVAVRIIGAGSNILACDGGVKGCVLKLDRGAFRSISVKGTRVSCGAGVPLPALIRRCSREGLSGAEFLAGIPGTVGGALAMNCGVSAGGTTVSIGDIVEDVTVLRYDGRVRVLKKGGVRFSYRGSSLSRAIVTRAVFSLRRSTPAKVAAGVRSWVERRRGQEYRYPSAGCVFRNPPGESAGRLIDGCGLKGREAGGARISERHANFIVNTGGARCSDVLALMSLIRKEVKKRRGIELRPEIKIWK
jgi:UDP-N-acetylmuramate dehydrogenase